MYLMSASRTRLAFGPGSEVLICGPIAVIAFGVMKSSNCVVGRWSKAEHAGGGRWELCTGLEDETSRCRRGWDALATATPPGTAAGTLACATSKPAGEYSVCAERA